MTAEAIFQQALGKSAEERAVFLDEVCAGQPELRAAVEALLAAHVSGQSSVELGPT